MAETCDYLPWGHLPTPPQRVHRLDNPEQLNTLSGSLLPFGLGRSYGDSCVNSEGLLVDTRSWDHYLGFQDGRLRCEAGVTLAQVVQTFVPKGWFLPVTPGTQSVTIGGAIANDVHGKNHHSAGTFGCHVREIGLWRSDRGKVVCSAEQEPELFAATIGGLGLTGLILWAEIQLKPIPGNQVTVQTHPFQDLDEFIALSARHQNTEYTVAWLDCFSAKDGRCRGLFYAGEHSAASKPLRQAWRPRMPFNLPGGVMNRATISAFNELYYRQGLRQPNKQQSLIPFFYPLDGIDQWHRLYGRKGFFQYQCVMPLEAKAGMQSILERIQSAGTGSFLGVLKVFADKPSPGLLSFPQPGICLALDLPNRGESTLALMRELDAILRDHGGRLYPAKDARMDPNDFQRTYPALEPFRHQCDPRFSSDFWRRVDNGARS
ncbi:FAD-binding oxidoreductase [Ferrimonas balearica]|uniref:FAD-binding oxidoreductase n=1 Tax=Ferrimonas balearica TaxID=44012 RepID=UPI001C980874|nr:FAD-binding oxidoreductase [Ferrimonas balearica]MBY6223065.1 FAD-binding oxidoreductase [Ferrimonas balearica]